LHLSGGLYLPRMGLVNDQLAMAPQLRIVTAAGHQPLLVADRGRLRGRTPRVIGALERSASKARFPVAIMAAQANLQFSRTAAQSRGSEHLRDCF